MDYLIKKMYYKPLKIQIMWLCKRTFNLTSNLQFKEGYVYKHKPKEIGTYYFKEITLVELRKMKMKKFIK